MIKPDNPLFYFYHHCLDERMNVKGREPDIYKIPLAEVLQVNTCNFNLLNENGFFCQIFKFSNPYIFVTWHGVNPWYFNLRVFVKTSGLKDIGVGISEFVAKTQFLRHFTLKKCKLLQYNCSFDHSSYSSYSV